MEAAPRLPMISCDLKLSPSNTEFGPILKKYIRDHYHEDPESYNKEIKELEALRQNAIKAPMDFTGCSILKRYYSQLHKLQSRFPMTDDGAACVPFMWTDIYSGVAYNITDIEYEEACILYNIGALHSKLGTMDSRSDAEGMKIACTHFQCAAWAFQHLRDTYPQPKGSDMSHDLLIFFINIMLAQAQECILEKSMLDSRKSTITAKIATQIVDYYKCALGIMVSGSPSTDTGSILDIVGSKIFKSWKKFIEFKMSYYTSISHLYMGNLAEEHEKWGERVAWFQSAYDHLTEAFKIAKNIDNDDLTESLTFTMDVIGGKHNSSKKENEFVYHEKVPALSSLPELKGASLVKGIPFSITDPDVSGPDIFARLVPMEAHETSSLYSEEKAKILRSVVSKIEGKNEELMAYLSSLQLESGLSFQDQEKIPQELLEKCAAMSVKPNAISELTESMNELLRISKEVDEALKQSSAILTEEEEKELKYQETFGKRGPSMIIVELKKECSKYEEAHKRAVESNNTLHTAINVHVSNISKLLLPLEELAEILPSMNSIKTPENVKIVEEFNHLINKVEEMRKQRQYLEQQLRDSLIKDDITKRLVTLSKKEDLQNTFAEELKKHSEILTYLDQNLAAQDNILCALTEANAHYAETKKAITEIKHQRADMTNALVSSYEAYDDLILKIKKGLEFYQKLQTNVTRLLTRIRSVTKVQDEERSQMITADLRKGSKMSQNTSVNVSSEQRVPKLKDYLQHFAKRGTVSSMPGVPYNGYPSTQVQSVPSVTPQFVTEPMRQATLGGPVSAEFDRKLKPAMLDSTRKDENLEISSIGVRPTPVGSEQTSIPAMCTTALSSADVDRSSAQPQHWPQAMTPSATFSGYGTANIPYQYPAVTNSHSQLPSSATFTSLRDANLKASQTYSSMPLSSNNNSASLYYNDKLNFASPQLQGSVPAAVASSAESSNTVAGSIFQSIQTSVAYPYNNNMPASTAGPSSNVSHTSRESVGYSATNIGQKCDNFATIRNPVKASVPQYGGFSQFNNNVPSVASSNMPTFGQHVVSPNSTASQISYQHQVYPFAEQSKLFHPPAGQQNQYHLPQGNQFTQPPGYILPSSTYDPRIQASASYDPRIQTGVNNYHPSVQYYHASGNVVQAGQSSVTASMDTRTSTFNSVNPYSFANPPSSSQPQHIPSSHVMNSSDGKMYMTPNAVVTNSQISSSVKTIPQTSFSSMNAAVPPGTTMYSSVAPNSFQPTVENASVAYPGGQSTYQNVPSSLNQFSSPVSQQPSASAYSGTVMNTPGSIASQHLATQQSNVSSTLQSAPLPYSGNAYATQQPFPPAVDPLSNCSMASANGIYNSNNSIPNQQLPIPIEPIPLVTSPPVQPAAIAEISQVAELKSPAPVVLSSTYTESQLKSVSDNITPQPKPNTADATEAKIELTAQSPVHALEPKLMDIKDIAPLREKESMQVAKDPLDDPSVRSKFVSEVEKYEKFVDGLVRKSLNGTTPLDQKWKELIDIQDKESRKLSISVARCYPLKNRFPDVMPYDSNRVKLISAKDDYINASYLKDICPSSPVFVITQAPLPATFSDFWLMVWEQQVETLICLLSDTELRNHVYFPKERGQVLTCGAYEISLHNHKEKNGFVERMINVTHIKNRTSRVVVHLQFTQWPASGVPQSPAPLLQFISDVISYQKQQRNLLRPVVVHCSAGIGRSGCFCLITALVTEMNSGHGPRDVAQIAGTVSQQRKFLIQEKEQLKFCYDAVLYYAQDLLMRRGILTTRASFDDKLPGSGSTNSHVRHPSEDFILGSGGLAKLQSGIAKMGLSSENVDIEKNVSKSEPSVNKSSLPVNNGDVTAENSAETSTTDTELSSEPTVISTDAESPPADKKDSIDKNLPSITSILDPSNFTLESTSSPAKRKITKENFASSKGSLSTSSSDSADPLSQLDPLWSLKK